jgi:hypothetical protein
MDLIDILASAQGGHGLENLGQQFGLSPAQTRAAVEALAPVVASGLSRNASSNDGLADLLGAVLGGNHGRYLEDPNAITYETAADDGNAILGHIFGSKDVSRGVAMKAGEMSGVGGAILKKMLPVIATMVMGALAKRMFGGGAAAGGAGGGGLGDILGDILGGGRAAPQSQSRQAQAPQGGIEDILKDILGGGAGGGASPAPRGGQPNLEDMLKDILGGGSTPSGRVPRPVQEEAARRGRETLDDVLGRRSSSGNPADDLLNSVERSLRR